MDGWIVNWIWNDEWLVLNGCLLVVVLCLVNKKGDGKEKERRGASIKSSKVL